MAKECKNCSESSPTTYTRCPDVVSTQCVFYQGENLECESDATFSVCKGQNMSIVQETIFNKICELSGQLDITELEFPCSLQEAWEEEDPTILNLLTYFAQIACNQQTSIAQLTDSIANINPAVEICLECCDDNCGTAKILLSDALNKIVACLCAAKAQITSLQDRVTIVETSYNGLQTQLDILQNFNTVQVALNIDLQLRLSAVEAKVSCLPDC